MELNITSRCRQRIMDALQKPETYGHNLYEILIEAEQEIDFLIISYYKLLCCINN
jgi:hypothetical protein